MRGLAVIGSVLASLLGAATSLESPGRRLSDVHSTKHIPLLSRLKGTIEEWYDDGSDFLKQHILPGQGPIVTPE